MRLFSAFAVSDEARAALSAHHGGLPEARWVDPADYHVTLAFYGDIESHIADELAQALAAIDVPPLELRFASLSIFGADRPHAIVALVEKSPALLALEAAHRSIAKRLEIDDRLRKYTPHVTLARLRRTSAGEVAGWMSAQPALPSLAWRVERFALYSSRTSRGGGPYVPEVEFALSG